MKILFHAVWKNVQNLINVQGQIRSCRVEVGPKLNKLCSTFIRHTRVRALEIESLTESYNERKIERHSKRFELERKVLKKSSASAAKMF